MIIEPSTGPRSGLAVAVLVADLIAAVVVTLADYPAERPGWVSPCFLTLSLWLVSLFCRWPIPQSVCDCQTDDCEMEADR